MIRPLTVRLKPQTISWAVSFAFLEVGVDTRPYKPTQYFSGENFN